MAESEEKRCPRDCKLCSMPQQVYCAAQVALSTMDMIQVLSSKIDAITGQMKGLVTEAGLVEPMAQQGAAAQTIDSPSKKKK